MEKREFTLIFPVVHIYIEYSLIGYTLILCPAKVVESASYQIMSDMYF